MLLEKIKTPGLDHLSYLIGSGGKAAVIDPRRDCECYVEMARAEGLEITHIFETHRNEDLVSGAPILKELTGARVFHGLNAAGTVEYAETAQDGDELEIGQLKAEREFSTLGHERANNPRLQLDSRDTFVDFKVEENHYQPPYFRLMERLNLEGSDPAPRIMRPKRLSLSELGTIDADHLVDVREPLAFASGYLPGSMNLPVGMISAFAGWFIAEGESVALIASDEN